MNELPLLTIPQLTFLRELGSSKSGSIIVWPGPKTRVANKLRELGLIKVVSDYAAFTELGQQWLTEWKRTSTLLERSGVMNESASKTERYYRVQGDCEGIVECYLGFNRDYNPFEMDLICVVRNEDTHELFVMDDTRAARLEIARYLAEREDRDNLTIVGVYRRVK